MPNQPDISSSRYYNDPYGALTDFVNARNAAAQQQAVQQQEAMLVQQALEQQRAQSAQQAPQRQLAPERAMFGLDNYEFNQQRIADDLNLRRNQALQAADAAMRAGDRHSADYIIKTRLEPLDKMAEKSLKPFINTEDFNVVKEFVNSDDFKKKKDSLNMLYNSIKSVDEKARTDPQFATSLARTFLTTLVNSAKGTSDAEQDNEFSRRAPELQTFREWARSRNMSPMNPMAIREFLDQRNANDPAYKAVIDKFAANPQAYIAKTKIIHDDLAKSYSDTAMQRVVLPTNPEFAEKKLGVYRPKFFAEEDAKDAKKADEFAATQRMKALDQDPRVGRIKEMMGNPNLSPEVRKKAQDALGAIENSMFGVQIKGGDMR